jgi:tetratricopeptide (TPR) repeat protein
MVMIDKESLETKDHHQICSYIMEITNSSDIKQAHTKYEEIWKCCTKLQKEAKTFVRWGTLLALHKYTSNTILRDKLVNEEFPEKGAIPFASQIIITVGKGGLPDHDNGLTMLMIGLDTLTSFLQVGVHPRNYFSHNCLSYLIEILNNAIKKENSALIDKCLTLLLVLRDTFKRFLKLENITPAVKSLTDYIYKSINMKAVQYLASLIRAHPILATRKTELVDTIVGFYTCSNDFQTRLYCFQALGAIHHTDQSTGEDIGAHTLTNIQKLSPHDITKLYMLDKHSFVFSAIQSQSKLNQVVQKLVETKNYATVGKELAELVLLGEHGIVDGELEAQVDTQSGIMLSAEQNKKIFGFATFTEAYLICVKEMRQVDSTSKESYLLECKTYLLTSKYGQLLASSRKAMELHPKEPYFYYAYLHGLLATKPDSNEPMQVIEKLLKMNPKGYLRWYASSLNADYYHSVDCVTCSCDPQEKLTVCLDNLKDYCDNAPRDHRYYRRNFFRKCMLSILLSDPDRQQLDKIRKMKENATEYLGIGDSIYGKYNSSIKQTFDTIMTRMKTIEHHYKLLDVTQKKDTTATKPTQEKSVDQMSISELKKELIKLNIDHSDMLEKSDFINALKNHQSSSVSQPVVVEVTQKSSVKPGKRCDECKCEATKLFKCGVCRKVSYCGVEVSTIHYNI